VHMIVYNRHTQTAQNSTDNLPLNLQINIIAQMPSNGGNGLQLTRKKTVVNQGTDHIITLPHAATGISCATPHALTFTYHLDLQSQVS